MDGMHYPIVTLFSRNQILQETFVEDYRKIVQALAFENSKINYPIVNLEFY